MNSISIIADPIYLDSSVDSEHFYHLKEAILRKNKKILVSSYEGGILSSFQKNNDSNQQKVVGYFNEDFSNYFSMNEKLKNIIVPNYGHKLDLLFEDSDAFIFVPSGINMITTFLFVLSEIVFTNKIKAIGIYHTNKTIEQLYDIFILFSKQYGIDENYFNQFILFNDNPWALLNEMENCSRRIKRLLI